MRPLWFPDRKQRIKERIIDAIAAALALALFAGIGVMLAWRG